MVVVMMSVMAVWMHAARETVKGMCLDSVQWQDATRIQGLGTFSDP